MHEGPMAARAPDAAFCAPPGVPSSRFAWDDPLPHRGRTTVLRIGSMARACVLVTTVLVASTASPVRGQSGLPKRFELTPFGGYNWGGSYETSASGLFSAGEASENSSFSWGAILSFLAERNSAAELYYLRQDTDVSFSGAGNGPASGRDVETGFANNYIQLGVRQGLELGQNLKPFITASLGV